MFHIRLQNHGVFFGQIYHMLTSKILLHQTIELKMIEILYKKDENASQSEEKGQFYYTHC